MASPRSSSPPPVETSRLWEEFVNTNRTLYRRHRELGEPTYPFDQGTDYRRTWADLVHAHQRVFLSHRESSSTLSSPSGADPEFPESTTLSPQIPPTREPSPSGMAEHGTEGTDCGNVGRIPNLKKSLSTTKVPYNWQRTRSFTSVPSISVFGSTSSEMPAKERLSRRHTYQRPTDIMTKNLPRETHWKHAHGLGLVSLDSGEASGETETGGGKRLKRFNEVLSFLHLSFFGGCTLSPMSAVIPMRVFYTVMSFNEASEDLLLWVHCYLFSLPLPLVAHWVFFTVILCCSSVRGEVSDIWIEASPGPARPPRADASGKHRVAEVANRHRR